MYCRSFHTPSHRFVLEWRTFTVYLTAVPFWQQVCLVYSSVLWCSCYPWWPDSSVLWIINTTTNKYGCYFKSHWIAENVLQQFENIYIPYFILCISRGISSSQPPCGTEQCTGAHRFCVRSQWSLLFTLMVSLTLLCGTPSGGLYGLWRVSCAVLCVLVQYSTMEPAHGG